MPESLRARLVKATWGGQDAHGGVPMDKKAAWREGYDTARRQILAAADAIAAADKPAARREAVASWPVIADNRQGDALRKWVQYGDMSQVDEPHYTLIKEWEAVHGVL